MKQSPSLDQSPSFEVALTELSFAKESPLHVIRVDTTDPQNPKFEVLITIRISEEARYNFTKISYELKNPNYFLYRDGPRSMAEVYYMKKRSWESQLASAKNGSPKTPKENDTV